MALSSSSTDLRLALGMQELADRAAVDRVVVERDLLRRVGDRGEVRGGSSSGPFASTWPTRSSTCRRCMIRTIAPSVLLSRREQRVESYHSVTAARFVSDIASPGFIGSSMMMRLPPRPVSVPAHRGRRAGSPAPSSRTRASRVLARIDPGPREELPVPGALDHDPAIARVLRGEVLGVARADDPKRSGRGRARTPGRPPRRRSTSGCGAGA